MTSLHIHVERPNPAPDIEVTGVITAIEPHLITLGIVRVHVRLHDGCALPLAVGQTITVRQSMWVEGIHPINNACITSNGELIAGLAGNGDPSFAPGWEIVAAAPEVRITRRGVRAVLRDNRMERVIIGDEEWSACGHAVAWGPGPRPPDSKTYHRYELVRLR